MARIFGPFRRIAQGSATSVRERDHTYFTQVCPRTGHTRFREDMYAIVGGALAATLIAATLTSLFHVPFFSDGQFAAAAAVAGGLTGKFALT
jgi:hypothetical protein